MGALIFERDFFPGRFSIGGRRSSLRLLGDCVILLERWCARWYRRWRATSVVVSKERKKIWNVGIVCGRLEFFLAKNRRSRWCVCQRDDANGSFWYLLRKKTIKLNHTILYITMYVWGRTCFLKDLQLFTWIRSTRLYVSISGWLLPSYSFWHIHLNCLLRFWKFFGHAL